MTSYCSQFFAINATIAFAAATGMICNSHLAAAHYHEQSFNTTNTASINKEELAHTLFAIGAIKFGDFVLKSGISSPYYIDMRRAISYPEVLHALALCLKDIQQQCDAEIVCAVPYGAIPVATALSMISGIPMVMARKEAKNYGTKNMIEGVYTPGQECLIIEDVITTGASVLETIKIVEAAGLKVKDVIGLIDRQQGGAENIRSHGYRFHAIFTLEELLSLLKIIT